MSRYSSFAASMILIATSCVALAGAPSNLLTNGGFEVTGQWAQEYLAEYSRQANLKDFDPVLPVGWTFTFNPGVKYEVVADAHSGKGALKITTTKNYGAQISFQAVEVAPSGTYTFGLWSKGAGKVAMQIVGVAFEGGQNLARKEITAGAAWAQTTQTLEIPRHIRMVRIDIYLSADSQILLDDVFFGAELAEPFDPDAVLTTKVKVDADTLMFIDFDGQGPQAKLENNAAIIDGGRFGKCLHLDRKSMSIANVPISIKKMPPEGTLEFWMSRDEVPQLTPKTAGTQQSFLQLSSGGTDVVHFNTSYGQMHANWRVTGGSWDPAPTITVPEDQGSRWFRKGQWNHIAFEWDTEAVRVYVNGALINYNTTRPLPFFNTPSAIQLGPIWGGYSWSGAFDEIRLSKVKRYGPKVPKDLKWLTIAPALAAAPKPVEARKLNVDVDAERAKLLAPIPAAPDGAIAFDAAQLKPLVDGDKSFAIEKDKPVPGMTTAWVGKGFRLMRDPDFDGGYWKLDGIKPGRYYVGVWHSSGQWLPVACLYLNGRIMQCSTRSDPVQVKAGESFSESQTSEAVELKDGDDIWVLPQLGDRFRAARLTLYPAPMQPSRGRNWEMEQYEATWFHRGTDIGLSLDASFLAAKGKVVQDSGAREIQSTDLPTSLLMTADGKRGIAQCLVNNPLPLTVKAQFDCTIKSYFRKTVGEFHETLTLQPHQQIRREIPFEVIADSRRYTIDAHISAIDPPNPQAALGWPAADTLNFFPGVRQNLPWPDPFTARDMRGIRFTQPLPSPRTEVVLDGLWQSAWASDLHPSFPPPAGAKWEPLNLPLPWGSISFQDVKPPPHGLYVRRKFNVPAADVQRMHQLIIAKAMDEATVYVNGKRLGCVRGTNTPLVCDMTPALKAGENEITIILCDLFAIMDPDYVNEKAPVASPYYLDAPGGGSFGGSLGLGEITVQTAPPLAASDLLVITSVRKKQLAARFSLTNHTAAARKVRVKVHVLDAETPVLDLGEQEIDLKSGQASAVEFSKPWANPVLWAPATPQLYTLSIETVDASTGEALDLLKERFGFRESWIDGDKIYFNGARIRPKGCTCQGGGIFQSDVQIQRTVNDPDFSDEAGFMSSAGLAGVGNTPSKHNAERDVFWEVARNNAAAGARLLARHPSIIAWDLSNEWLSFLAYGSGNVDLAARQMESMTDAVGKVDPSRWTFYNGDGDLHGLHNTFSTHYMMESAQGSPTGDTYNTRGHSSCFPDGAFFRPLDQEFKAGQEVFIGGDTKFRYGSKVLMDTENLWKVGGYMPPGPSKFIGEEDVLSSAFDTTRGAMVWMWKQNLDAHRDLGVSSVSSYGPRRREYSLQCFIMPDYTHHFFSGAEVSRAYSLHNDLFVPAKFSFQWKLLDAQGKVLAQIKDDRQMDSGDLQRGRMSIKLPSANARTTLTLKLTLLADGKMAYEEERDLEVWPNAPIAAGGKTARRLSVYDPRGATAKALTQAGVAFDTINFLTLPAGQVGSTALLIGEGAIDPATQADQERLSAYVQAGGRVLVLAQTPTTASELNRVLGNLPVNTTLETRQWSSMPFVRTPQHPALKGITSWDLHFWSPDHVSARGAWSKPVSGPAVALIDSGCDRGLEWAQLMEVFHGKGNYLLCQLPVIGSYDKDPMARELLARLVNYIGAEAAFLQPARRLTVATQMNSLIADKLRDWGVAFDLAKPEQDLMSPQRVTMIEGRDLPKYADKAAQFKAALNGGAVLILHDVWPAENALVNDLAGQDVRMTVQPLKIWDGRGYRNGFTGLTAGISHLDLYWKRYEGGEIGWNQAIDPSYKIEDLVNWSVSCAAGTEHVYPGGLLEIPVGKGKLIIDQLRWEIPNQLLATSQGRVVTAMMLGLGVTIEPAVVQRALPPNVTCQPLDIHAVANRSLRDEGKGENGWTGQGPDADLRNLTTGAQNFGGTPFTIAQGPQNCIALKSEPQATTTIAGDTSRDKLPPSVTIPVGTAGGTAGMQIEGLWFLHAAAFTGDGLAGMYQVQYQDGSTLDIPLVSGLNLRDWTAPPAAFAGEKGTQSFVAWTGTTNTFPTVCVFRMLWVNPRPGSPVKAVKFSNPSTACPVLIALTAVVKSSPAGQVAAAQAVELYNQAVQALRDNQDAQAETLLKKAVAADPSNAGACQALAQLYDKMKNEDLAFEAYRAWAAAGPNTYIPYNRIGQIYEARKQYKQALEAYTRSLQIEWNQPPTIEAKSRMEKLVKD